MQSAMRVNLATQAQRVRLSEAESCGEASRTILFVRKSWAKRRRASWILGNRTSCPKQPASACSMETIAFAKIYVDLCIIEYSQTLMQMNPCQILLLPHSMENLYDYACSGMHPVNDHGELYHSIFIEKKSWSTGSLSIVSTILPAPTTSPSHMTVLFLSALLAGNSARPRPLGFPVLIKLAQ